MTIGKNQKTSDILLKLQDLADDIKKERERTKIRTDKLFDKLNADVKVFNSGIDRMDRDLEKIDERTAEKIDDTVLEFISGAEE